MALGTLRSGEREGRSLMGITSVDEIHDARGFTPQFNPGLLQKLANLAEQRSTPDIDKFPA